MPIKSAGDKSTPIQEMQGKGFHIHNDPILTDTGVSERRPQGYDEFTVDDDMARDLGISDQLAAGWQPAWIRDGRYWSKHEKSDRFFEFRRANPGSVAVKVDGEPYTHGDLMLCLKPPAVAEQIAREKQSREDAFFKEMMSEKKDDDFDPDDKSEIRRRAQSNSEQHMLAGMIGRSSKTEGMSLEEAYSILHRGQSEAQMHASIQAEEIKWARGGRTYVDRDEAPQESRRGGTTYSIPANVKPRNLAK